MIDIEFECKAVRQTSERVQGERGVCRGLPNLPLRAAVLRRAPSGGRSRM